jgi:molybdopterin molybdotransferase
MSGAAERVLSFEQARHVVLQHAAQLRCMRSQRLPLLQALGRTLAEDIPADRDYPPFHRATRDGYAVRSADLASVPVDLRLQGQIKAGSSFAGQVEAGDCVEIMTGAPVPRGADAVVMVEHTSANEDRVEIKRTVRREENIVAAGSEAKRGDVVLRQGQRLTAAAVAVAASVGRAAVEVYQRPRVGILSTGDEVIKIESPPGPHQIRNSNAYSLAAQVVAAGGDPVRLRIAPDESAELRRLIEEGLRTDLLLLTGGVSMGKYDLAEEVLGELGAEFFFTGALIQPGRPVVFGRVGERYFFGLPGNPVSTMVTFKLFAKSIVEALSGALPSALRFSKARLQAEFTTKPGLTRFLPARLSGAPDDPTVELLSWKGSGDVFTVARADCFLVVPPDREKFAAGEQLSVLLL